MKLYDSATGRQVTTEGQEPVLMYVCGITPYDSAHIGHAFTFLTYDLIARRCRDAGRTVKIVRNITDVDEPIYARARELGIPYLELAERETEAFRIAMRAINLLDVDVEPRASEHIDAIAGAVCTLIDKGFAYNLNGDVYFDVKEAEHFGMISGYDERLMSAFSDMRGGDTGRLGKRSPLDFLLWRGIDDPADPAAWHTPVGYGRPGWHIECTVMSLAHLGSTVTIHGGGTDLIFPHHECENAQSMALGSEPFARQWVHTAPMLLGGEKMSKSLGNLVFVRDLIEKIDPAAVRIALMTYRYRNGGEWRADALEDGCRMLAAFQKARTCPKGPDARPYLSRLRAALDDDLNAPECLRILTELADSLMSGTGKNSCSASGLEEGLELMGIKAAA